MKSFKELNSEFDISKEKRKTIIRKEPNKWKRFGKGVAYFLLFPFQGVWVNIRDGRTAVIFISVVLVVSSEVGVMYLLYFITGNEWFLGIGSACWLFWLGPGTPFMVLCIGITIGIKALINRMRRR